MASTPPAPDAPVGGLRGLMRDLLCMLLMLAACVTLLHPVLLGGKIMSASHWWASHGPFPLETVRAARGGLDQFGDQMMQFVPWLRYAADAYAVDGAIPLWKTTQCCGAPFVGNAQSAVWWPTNLLSILLGAPPWMLAVGVLFKLAVGACGAYALARHLGASRLASMLCGMTFGIGGFQAVWALYPLGSAACLFPLVVLAVDRLALRPGWGRLGALAVVAGLQHLAGHPETTFHCQTLAFALGAVRAVSLRGRPGPRPLARLAAVAGGLTLGALLAAAQILPVLEYIKESDALRLRKDGHGFPGLEQPLASLGFLAALVAGALATRALARGRRPAASGLVLLLAVTGGLWSGLASSFNPCYLLTLAADWYGEPAYFMGSGNYVEQNGAFLGAALAVAGAGLLHGRPRGTAKAAGVALVLGLLVGCLAPVVYDLLMLVPGYHVAANSRLQLLALLAGAVLAALGLDAIGRATRPLAGARVALLTGAGLAGAFAALALALWQGLAFAQTAPQRPARAPDVEATVFDRPLADRLTSEVLARLEQIDVPPVSDDDVTIGGILRIKETMLGRLMYGRDGMAPALIVPYRVWGARLGGPPPRDGSPHFWAARVPRAALAPGSTRFMLQLMDRNGGVHYTPQLVPLEEVDDGPIDFPLRPALGRGGTQMLLLAGAALLAALGLGARGPLRVVVRLLLVGLVLGSLMPFLSGLVPALPPRLYYPSTPGLAALAGLPPQGRSMSFLHALLPAEIPTYYGIADVVGYDALHPHRIATLLRHAAGTPGEEEKLRQLPTRPDPDARLLGLMAVQVFAWPGAPYVPTWRSPRDVPTAPNPHYLPRARIVHHAEVEPDDEAAMVRLADPAFPRATAVLLAEAPADGAPPPPPAGDGDGAAPGGDRVAFASDRPDRLVLDVEPSAPGWLVLADTHFPGWRARVDGEERPILRANVAFRAVALRPGDRRVTFSYEPWTARAGLVASGIAALIAVAALLAGALGRLRTGSR